MARPTPSDERSPAPLPALRLRVGAAGEAAALTYVRDAGMTILDVDWRCRLGQADIVAREGDCVVLVEVKARRGAGYGLPQEAVDWRKRAKLRAVLGAYLQHTGRSGAACRIDVVAVRLDSRLQVRSIEHIRDAVGG